MIKALFIAWDGPYQNYLESLFLPIFADLAERGAPVHVMQFRWGSSDAVSSAREAAERLGIPYRYVPIARRPKALGTAATVAYGRQEIRRYATDHGIDVLMPRSVIPATMTLSIAAALGCRVLFDADGFPADERAEFAGWSPTGLTYRLFRDVEAQMVRRADAVVTRTTRARDVLVGRAGARTDPNKIHVIPNGKDEDLYHPQNASIRGRVREELGVPRDAPLVVYSGTLGPHYYPREMSQFFDAVRRRRSDAHFLVLTRQQAEACRHLTDAGLDETTVTLRAVAAEQVPLYLAASDVGLALRQASFSQQGVSPVKVGEYLLCGLPVLATAGVGDLDTQLDADHTGRILPVPDADSLEEAADWVLREVLPKRDTFRDACRRRGIEVFGLGPCVDRYEVALRRAAGR